MKHGACRVRACAEEEDLFDMLNQACNGRCGVSKKYSEHSTSVEEQARLPEAPLKWEAWLGFTFLHLRLSDTRAKHFVDFIISSC